MALSSYAATAVASLLVAASGPAPYNESVAATDIWLNQAVGCPHDAIQSWTCGPACTAAPTTARLIAVNDSKHTFALTARTSAEECIVVFRGSKDIDNVLEDLDFFPHPLPECGSGCKVHSGFYGSWKSLEPQVRDHLAQLGCGNSSLSIIGHSLGAAMAALAAFEFAAADATAPWRALRRLYTYGQPRTGNAAFATAFTARLQKLKLPHYRVVDYKDAVPHVPYKNMFGEGWVHTGPEVYYHATRRGAYAICARANDTACSAQWNLFQTLSHTCDHCSYLGMNPCDCGKSKPACEEPHGR